MSSSNASSGGLEGGWPRAEWGWDGEAGAANGSSGLGSPCSFDLRQDLAWARGGIGQPWQPWQTDPLGVSRGGRAPSVVRVVLDLRERDQVRARRLRLEANLEDKRGVLEQENKPRWVGRYEKSLCVGIGRRTDKWRWRRLNEIQSFELESKFWFEFPHLALSLEWDGVVEGVTPACASHVEPCAEGEDIKDDVQVMD